MGDGFIVNFFSIKKKLIHKIILLLKNNPTLEHVLKINADNNEIIVGPKEKLGKKHISLKDINLLTDKKDLDQNIFVKVRSTGNLLQAKVNLKVNNTAQVNLVNTEDGISPGQACVFYSKDHFGHRVLGGGWIYS